MKFHHAPSHIEEVFELVERVPCGINLLRRFKEHFSPRVRFDPYPPDLIKRLRQQLDPAHPIGACFVHDGTQGAIHYDPGTPLGILGPFLVHEIAHATDSDLWKVSQLKKASPLRKSILIETELRAFQLQQKFIKELKDIDLSYANFIDEVQARMRILAEDLSSSEIFSIYNFTRP